MLLSRRDFVGLMAKTVPLTKMMERMMPDNGQSKSEASERVYLDPEGIIRWKSDNREVALFGANYCLPSACDYRAAGYVNADRKKLIDEDMAHFARMGWDALRLSFWGDWENCDVKGNLIANDHLDLLDYLIARATARGIFMLFSPIVTYSSLWPDKSEDPVVVGFSRHFDKGILGTDPQAIAAQVNYLQQLLSHINPYTGVALKAEPNILFIEMINEPWHHSADFEGSVRYINTLVDAVRSTGCAKILFHNVSQDFGMAKAIQASKVQGSTYGWYPSGLDMRGSLHGNTLRAVDKYPHAIPPELSKKARVVYEFDMADVMSGYHYPAMTRAFRAIGAQFAAMFSYDMLATAPYNLGWQVHCLNMVYTPQKAVSAIIAGEVMRRVPRLRSYGDYPQNTHFDNFRVSYEENLSEVCTADAFMYSNDTANQPAALASLRKIVGYGSSPVIRYQGKGLYFLDKIEEGVWRLEVYPDAITVADPFNAPRVDRTVFRLFARKWPMHIHLADLGTSFHVTALNAGNAYSTQAKEGHFSITPGVYLLATTPNLATSSLPEKIAGVGMCEFVCPPLPEGPPGFVVSAQEEYRRDQKMAFSIMVAVSEAPHAVSLHIRVAGQTETRVFAMHPAGGYTYRVSLPPNTLPHGTIDYGFHVQGAKGDFIFPEPVMTSLEQSHANALTATVVDGSSPLTLFDAARDIGRLDVTRGVEQSQNHSTEQMGTLAFRLPAALASRNRHHDATASLYIGARIAGGGNVIRHATGLSIKMKTAQGETPVHLTLVEKDGTAWGATVNATPERSATVLALATMSPAKWALLPEGFPGDWAYWAEPTRRSGQMNLANVERIQFSLRQENGQPEGPHSGTGLTDVDVERIALLFASATS